MINVSIFDTLTQERVETRMDLPFNRFWWSPDGNAGCDCNRGLFFFAAATEREEGEATKEEALRYRMTPDENGHYRFPCSEGRFRVTITDLAGQILFSDEESNR